jgi:tetratricopeptide (TPR) repeat protein
MKKQPPKQFILKEHAANARMIYNASVWRQLPYILAYPFKGHALGVLIIFSVALSIFTLSPAAGLFGLVIFLSWTLKYTYAVLEYTALGHANPPMFSFDMWNPVNQRPLKQMFYFVVVFIIFFWIQALAGKVPGLLVLAIGLLLTPASVVIIATQNNLLYALNPLKLILLVKHIGSIYIFISLLFSLPLLVIWMSDGFPLLFRIMGIIYSLLMTFHLLGFVVYHRRESLCFEVSFSPEREAEAQEQAQDKQFEKVLDEVYWLARRQGNIKEAIETLFAKLPELGDTLDTHEKLFARLSLWEEKSVALAQAHYYITLLIQKKRLTDALAIYQACLDINAHFEPKTPYQILPLATTAYQEKRYSLALNLVQDFASRYPNHPDRIAIQLLTVKLLGEHFKRVDEAKAIMAQLLDYKEHPLYPDIKKYAAFLAKYHRVTRTTD